MGRKGQQQQNLPGARVINVFTTRQSIGVPAAAVVGELGTQHADITVGFCQKGKKGGERRESPRNWEAESGRREKPAGKPQSQVASHGSFSPWKINLHLILLRNCSS